MSLETLCFSMYSDISTRIMAFSLPNSASASALDSSVLPTPVGPQKINEPCGRFGSFNPVLPRRMARATTSTASSCPITRPFNILSRLSNFSLSSFSSFVTGIFVHWVTISAISSSPIAGIFEPFMLSRQLFFRVSNSADSVFSRLRSSAAFSNSWARTASSLSACVFLIFSSSSRRSGGAVIRSIRFFEAASSIRSIALSGKKRSVI